MVFADTIFTIMIIVLVLLAAYILVGPVLISSDDVAVIEKRFGRHLKNGDFIALHGEAGFQADILRTGLHFKCRIIYKIRKCPMITIKQDEMGYVFARSGRPLEPDQALAKTVECSNYQDARAFIENGGQKGIQRSVLREGTYGFNLAQFVILTSEKAYYIPIGRDDRKEIEEMRQRIATSGSVNEEGQNLNGFKPIIINDACDVIGTVTTNEGLALNQTDDIKGKEVVAPIVGNDPSDPTTYHNNFQKIDEFLHAGGRKGRQLQILTQGKYYINSLFATVKLESNVVIGASEVGVVTSYFGANGEDVTGEEYKHGDLVAEGSKGVLANPLRTGKYPLNPYAYKVEKVPVDNFVLRWKSGQANELRYDENLRELSVVTNDGYKPNIPLSIVVHIDYRNAPRVIQRFGSVKKLVEQTIDPMISAHFKKIAEKKTLIEFIQQKSEITEEVKSAMGTEFEKFNLEIEDVLIDTPDSSDDPRIDKMINQLSDRQLAQEQSKTYSEQMKAEAKLQELNDAQAKAEKQTALTASQVQIDIDANQAEAARRVAEKNKERLKIDTDANRYKTEIDAEARANAVKVEADAEANRVIKLADAEAHKTTAVGAAQAEAAEKNVRAYGGAEILVQKDVALAMADALKSGKIKIVPDNLIQNGAKDQGMANALEQFLQLVSLEKLGVELNKKTAETGKDSMEPEETEISKNADGEA